MGICALDIQKGRSESLRWQSRAGMSSPAGVWEGAPSGKWVLSPQLRSWTGQSQVRNLEASSSHSQAQGGLERVPSGKDGHAGVFPLPLSVIPDSAL